MTDYDYGTLEHRLRELAFLNSGVRIFLTDRRGPDEKREELSKRAGWRRSCASSTGPRSR
jgi:DNA gyrase subunit B